MRLLLTSFIAICLMLLQAWKTSKPITYNANSWSISVGKKVLLASWQNNEMGDTATLSILKIKSTDTLFAQRFLCGYNGNNSVSTLTVKNERNEAIAASIHTNKDMSYTAKMPLASIIKAISIQGKTIGIYFTIEDNNDLLSKPVLLGRLRLN